MKAFKTMFIAIATLLISAATLSAKDFAPNVMIEKVGYDKRISVIIDHLSGPATVQITTAEGFSLQEEKSKAGRFAKIFNVEQLELGTYKIVITFNFKEIEQPFLIEQEGLELNVNERNEYYVPVLNVKDESLDVMMLNNRLTNIDLSIMDTNGQTIFQDNMQNVIKVERRYDLNQLRQGRYMVRVKTPHKTYYHDIVVK